MREAQRSAEREASHWLAVAADLQLFCTNNACNSRRARRWSSTASIDCRTYSARALRYTYRLATAYTFSMRLVAIAASAVYPTRTDTRRLHQSGGLRNTSTRLCFYLFAREYAVERPRTRGKLRA